jgi:hypothetical protein
MYVSDGFQGAAKEFPGKGSSSMTKLFFIAIGSSQLPERLRKWCLRLFCFQMPIVVLMICTNSISPCRPGLLPTKSAGKFYSDIPDSHPYRKKELHHFFLIHCGCCLQLTSLGQRLNRIGECSGRIASVDAIPRSAGLYQIHVYADAPSLSPNCSQACG